MSHETLLRDSPLMEGEEVVATLDAAWLTDEHEFFCDAHLLLTTRRFGSANGHQTFFGPLHEVTSLYFQDDVIYIGYANDVVQAYKADDAAPFFNALVYIRSCVLRPEAHATFAAALAHLKAGRWSKALPIIEDASTQDPFHRGPDIARALVQRRLGRVDLAADTLLAHLIPMVDLLPQFVRLPFSFRLAGQHLYTLDTLCGDVDAADAHPLLVLLAALAARRRGQFDRLEHLLDRAYQRAEGEPVALVMISSCGFECAPADLWPRLADIYEDGARRARAGGADWTGFSDAAVSLIGQIADIEADPCGSARASTEFEDLLGEPSEDGAPWRALEDWTAVLDERTQRAKFPEAAVEASAHDVSAFGDVLEWLAIVADPAVDVEHYWGMLRAGRGKLRFAQAPEVWWRRIAGCCAVDSPKVWLAGLVAVEQHLRDGNGSDAEKLLNEIYQYCAVAIGDTRDIYTRWASSLYGLYLGLARQEAVAVRMYEGILRHHPGFGWTASLCERVLGKGWQEHRAARSSVAAFETWADGTKRLLNLDREPAYTKAQAELREARESKALRVVVGGETSSGKSSFINALLRAPVLFVTAEEATAVPTSVARGPTWSAVVLGANGSNLARIDVGAAPTEHDRQRFKHFVEEHSALSSRRSADVAQLRITSPDVDLPAGVELIDTPGLNAHAVRTKVAQATIDTAHACIFVLDAGAALKAGEISKIQWASEAVGKTVFVINKMDRAVGDDDLDVDDNAAADLLARVRSDLGESLGTTAVNLFAVCSLPEERLRRIGAPPETVAYAHAVRDVHSKLNEILSTSRELLVEYAAGKVAGVVAEIALERSHDELARHDKRMAELAYGLPGNPEAFREHVMSMVANVWIGARDTYVANMSAALDAAGQRADQRMISGIQGCADNEQLRAWVKRSARPILNDFVAEVDRARTEQWTAVGEIVLEVVRELFESLYRGVKFKHNLDTGALVGLATPIPLAKPGKSLDNALSGLIGDQMVATGGGAAAGAVIGTILFPGLGTVVGGWLGSMAGGAAVTDPSQGVYEKLHEQLSSCYEKAGEALDADMDGPEGHQPPILRGLAEGIETERTNFERTLRAEIQRVKTLREQARERSGAIRKAAVEAWDFSWQFRRRLEGAR